MKETEFSNKSIYRYAVAVLLLITFLYGVECAVYAYNDTVQECQSTMSSVKTQVEYRVEQCIALLESLAAEEQYANPNIPYTEKIDSIERIGENMGYMMIRYVDTDLNVCTARGKTSLASREYMQRLFATGERQVTDSFAAGADGVTLNYTVAVPMFYEGKVSGCLFCAIYFDEIQNLITQAVGQKDVQVDLLGSENQIMSSTDFSYYGDVFTDYVSDAEIIGNTRDKLEEDLLGAGTGNFWSIHNFSLDYSIYAPIANTNWSIVTITGFWSAFAEKILEGIWIFLMCAVLAVAMSWILGMYLPAQQARVQYLVESVRNLERKLSLNENADSHTFDEVLQLTSQGLNDSLTGVATRSVFANQIQGHLDKLSDDKLSVICFVDLDDLKKINDEYGHGAGDIALKEIGFILREYEKKYDGLVGRYGGDEFTLLMTGFLNMEELNQVMNELIKRLRFPMPEVGEDVYARCSIGAALYDQSKPFETLLDQADHALYAVKQDGKGTYKIYESGDAK